MSRRGSRPTIFVCACVSDTYQLIIESITASSQEDAISIFKEKHGFSPLNVLGPFFQKKTQILENVTSVKFTNVIKKAEYNGWNVNAILLSEPINFAYLVFVNRIDNKKISPPKGTVVVPYSKLRIIQDAQ